MARPGKEVAVETPSVHIWHESTSPSPLYKKNQRQVFISHVVFFLKAMRIKEPKPMVGALRLEF